MAISLRIVAGFEVCTVDAKVCTLEEVDDIRFEWDEANSLKLKGAGRGITPELCREIADIDPWFFIEARENRSGDYWMIGPDASGRIWTIVLVSRGDGLWRPISGWPSTNRQIRSYHERA